MCVGVKLGNSHEGKNTLRVFGDWLLRRIIGHKREEVTEDEENCTVNQKSLCIYMVMCHITTFWSTMDRMYDGGPLR